MRIIKISFGVIMLLLNSGCSRCRITEIQGPESVISLTGDLQVNCQHVILDGNDIDNYNGNISQLGYLNGDHKELIGRGDHDIQFVLNTGEIYSRKFQNETSIKIEFWPKKSDAFVERGGYIIVFPFAIITWPIWGPIMWATGG